MMKLFRCVVTGAIAVFGAPTLAASAGDVATTWTIVSQAPSPSEQIAAIGELVVRQSLRPQAIAVLTEHALDTKSGAVKLGAGTALMQMSTTGPTIFCEAAPRKASAATSFLLGTITETAICLIDANRDGSFDGYFSKKVQFGGFPVIRGGYPERPDALRPLAYTTLVDMPDAGYFIGLSFISGTSAKAKQVFRVVFGGSKDRSALTNSISGPAGDFPKVVEILGGRITLLAIEGKSLRYRVDTPFPEQPFSVSRTFQRF